MFNIYNKKKLITKKQTHRQAVRFCRKKNKEIESDNVEVKRCIDMIKNPKYCYFIEA